MAHNERGEIIPDPPKNEEGGCYIATACYGDYNAPQVLVFRQFRDDILLKSRYGRNLVQYYYHYSPHWATKLKNARRANQFVRLMLLNPLYTILKRLNFKQKSR